MAGFTSPSILFLSTWDAPERSYCAGLLSTFRKAGYSRYVEPSVGGFAMPLVALDAGWSTDVMDTSDVSLFTSLLGSLASGRDLARLEVAVDEEPVPLTGDPLADAAHLLWVQLLARTEVRPDGVYWRNMIADLRDGQATHEAAFRKQLHTLTSRLEGISYEPLSLWDHLDAVKDDPQAVVISNPPTYRGAYEKFYDTKGRLTWAQPEYEVFNAPVDIPRMVEVMEGQAALLVVQQQQEPGNAAHAKPIYARHLSLGQNVYINTNRPDEVLSLMGGPRIVRKKAVPLEPMPYTVLPVDYEVTPQSRVDLVPVGSGVADRYRGQWMHRLKAEPGSGNVLMLIDGYAAGVMGFNAASMSFSYSEKWSSHVILRFAFGAPHESLRLTRLATMLALQKTTLELTATPLSAIFVAASEGLVTIEMTRHPEAKGLRGLMKLDNRQKHPDGWKLVYAADWATPATPAEVLAEFLTKEKQWQKSSAPKKASA